MLYRCYVKKNTDDATDFESNYKSRAIEVDRLIIAGGVEFLKSVDYSTFKSYIDGETLKWEDVKYKEYENFYELWLEV